MKCAFVLWLLFLTVNVLKLKGSFFFFKFYLFIFLFMAVLGLRFSVRGLSLVAASGGHSSSRCAGLSLSRLLLLWSTGSRRAGSVVVAHRLQTRRLSSCGSRAQSPRGMWDPPRPGPEPVSPAPAGGLSTTAPPGKPLCSFFFKALKILSKKRKR